jgi:hypothetical protein
MYTLDHRGCCETWRPRVTRSIGLSNSDEYQNLIIELRVMVTWLVTPAGPPLKR